MNKKVPEFRSTEEERAYWDASGLPEGTGLTEDRTTGAGGLKLPERGVCLRLPGAMMEELRVQARLFDVPQQLLMKTYLVERIEREMRKERSG